MYAGQYPFYRFFALARRYGLPPIPVADLFALWLAEADEAIAWVTAFARRQDRPWPDASREDLWMLYGLSRVGQVLVESFQPNPRPLDGCRDLVTVEQYIDLMRMFSLRVEEGRGFSPFFHEIVTVEEAADPDAPISIRTIRWPCLMLGDMLFARAGCDVVAGRKHVKKEIAETSTMYWCYTCTHRPRLDMSHGWGSNSQWRTQFRRDYLIDGVPCFNVDGQFGPCRYNLAADAPAIDRPPNPFGSDNEMTWTERVELLHHRCFVTVEKDSTDLFPFDDYDIPSSVRRPR